MTANALEGKRILLTGATGFVGSALLEALLREPVARLYVLIRDKDGQTAEQHLDEMLTGPRFAGLRAELAGSVAGHDAHGTTEYGQVPVTHDGHQEAREVVEADPEEGEYCPRKTSLRNDAPVPTDEQGLLAAHTLVHERAQVTDRAEGSGREQADDSARTDTRTGADEQARARLRSRIELLRGDLRSLDPLSKHSVRLPSGLDVVINAAADVGFDEPLTRALAANVAGPAALVAGLRAAGATPHVVHFSTAYVNAGRTDLAFETRVRHEVDWREELSLLTFHPERAADPAAGRARAEDFGWTDTYTYSKTLGEDVLEELWARQGGRLSVLRPSIVERSARLERTPGRPGHEGGYKLVDPLVNAYATGALPGLPGGPSGVLDVVPMQAVVDTTKATIALPPLPGLGRYYHVTTGTVAPLTIEGLRRHVDEALSHRGQPADSTRTPRMKFRNHLLLAVRLLAEEKALDAADRLLGTSQARAKRRRRLEGARRYLRVYGPYLRTTTAFNSAATSVLLAEYRAKGGRAMDLHGFDWRAYFHQVHLPALARERRWWPEPTDGHDATAPEATTEQVSTAAATHAPTATTTHAPSPATTHVPTTTCEVEVLAAATAQGEAVKSALVGPGQTA